MFSLKLFFVRGQVIIRDVQKLNSMFFDGIRTLYFHLSANDMLDIDFDNNVQCLFDLQKKTISSKSRFQ